jgi:hypothetical protein
MSCLLEYSSMPVNPSCFAQSCTHPAGRFLMQDRHSHTCIIHSQIAEQHRQPCLLLQCHILIWGCAHFARIPCLYVTLFFCHGMAR